ncbi:MAG: DMT family transporter [Bacteroidales bacterium]|nr:DMT family transporter [Bacteroidales bacterium]
MLSEKTKGIACGILSAICYGMNPLGALNLYAENLSTTSVLFYRFGFAILILALIMGVKRISFRINKKELLILSSLGVLFAVSSLSLFMSFLYMPAGVASTLLFTHPIMVALIMALVFKERITSVVVFSIALAFGGVCLLYYSGEGIVLNTMGVILVLLSAFRSALYMIVVNKSSINLPTFKVTFYALIFCWICVSLFSFSDESFAIQPLTNFNQLFYVLLLSVVTTVMSLCLMNVAVRILGSTPTSIMGALEPLTAVIIGVCVFDEVFSLNLALGIVLILLSVMLIILQKKISKPRF